MTHAQFITTNNTEEDELTLWIRQPYDRDFFEFGPITLDQRQMLQDVGLLDGGDWLDGEET